MGKMINVIAAGYQDFVSFCHKNKVDQKDARYIRDVSQMFGIWQGDLYILHPMQGRRGIGDMIDEANRRGLTVKFRDRCGTL